MSGHGKGFTRHKASLVSKKRTVNVVEKNYFKTLHDLCMNISGSGMFACNAGIIHELQMKSNQIALHPLY